MGNQTKPLNLTDFTGGLNLRANEFNLAENESPNMLNVEVDPRGGVYTRKGWERWNPELIAAEETWNPRTAFIHELASGLDILMITNNGKIEMSSNGTFATLQQGETPVDVVVSATPHLADFASWGDTLYVACGHNQQAVKRVGEAATATLLTASGVGNWDNDDLVPGSGKMPAANFIAAHAARIWVASTMEDGVFYPNRVRWSFSNVPESWGQNDYVDILEGGGPITAIVAHEDHLLVFKQSSVWAIYGYERESQQIVNVSRKVGAFNRQVIAWSEDSVYFVSWPDGVYRITRGKLEEVSMALRPAFTSSQWNPAATGFMWLGWLGHRLWFSAPYWEDGVASDARSIFVFDPSMDSWTMFRSSEEEGLGPFAQGGYGQGSYDLFGVCRCGPVVVKVDERDDATDTIMVEPKAFDTLYTTPWLHAGWPDRKKRWRRPTFITSVPAEEYTLKCSVFVDFEEGAPKRRFDVTVGAPGGVVLYDDGLLYDDGVEYMAPIEGSTLERGTGFGSARAVQLKIEGQRGRRWRIDGIVAKYRMRRFT